MKIIKLEPPSGIVPEIPATDAKGNSFLLVDVTSDFFGEAVSTRGRRYRFSADVDGASAVFRLEQQSGACDFWRQIKAPCFPRRLLRRSAPSPRRERESETEGCVRGRTLIQDANLGTGLTSFQLRKNRP
jgi:hypothetical protein